MKPRNEREREVMRLSAKLPQITKSQLSYALEHCFDHRAALHSAKHHTYYCLDCGETITATKDTKRITCPNCGHKLTTDGVRQKKKEVSSFQVITTIKGWQVLRTWYVERITRGGYESMHEVYEVTQRWMMPGKKDIIVALNKVFMPRYYDQFDKWSNMSIKEERYLQYYANPYDIDAFAVYPHQSILPELKRNGYCQWFKDNMRFNVAFHCLLDNPKYEILAKHKRFDLLSLREGEIADHWVQIRLALRHDYHPEDVKVWKDTIDMVSDLGYDDHSPKYVLPENLGAMHDWLIKRKNARDREAEIEKNRKYQFKFMEEYGRFLGIVIEVGDITIRPLQNFEDFYDEGKAMHHCVATYFGREGSLILSARKGGLRLATIELDTEKFDVKQCRGLQNCVPERHDEIVRILAAHKKDFLRAKRLKKVA